MGSTGTPLLQGTLVENSIYTMRENEDGGQGLDMNDQVTQFENSIHATQSQMDALRFYAYGGYSAAGELGKEAFSKQHQLEQLVDNNKQLHLLDAKLFRGGYLTNAEYEQLLQGTVPSSMMDGLTSWSLREDVAHMYAQGDFTSGEVFGGRTPQGGHRVIFVESSTNDSMPLPYTYPQDETLRSSRKYTITSVVTEENYQGKETDGGRSATWSGYDEPVTYVYVKSQKKKGGRK